MNIQRHTINMAFLIILLLSHNSKADENYLYVVSSDETLTTLHKNNIKNIYMDSALFNLKPINLTQGHTLRAVFNSKVIGLTESRIAAYWTQMKFTGRAKPPIEFETEPQIVEFLKSNPGYIGYISHQHGIPSYLKILHKFPY